MLLVFECGSAQELQQHLADSFGRSRRGDGDENVCEHGDSMGRALR